MYLLVEMLAALSVHKHKGEMEISGDGQAAFKELRHNYDKMTDEAIRATMEKLVNTPMKPGQNPNDYPNEKHLLHNRADKMGRRGPHRWYKEICGTGFTKHFKDMKILMYGDSMLDIENMQPTARHMLIDESREGSQVVVSP